jgi:hypothetical protein
MTNKRIHMLSIEKEKLVIDLYYNQRKNVHQIAQEATAVLLMDNSNSSTHHMFIQICY